MKHFCGSAERQSLVPADTPSVLTWSRAALTRKADFDGDGEVTLEDGHLAFEKSVPIVRRHTALASGLVGGFVTAYSLR